MAVATADFEAGVDGNAIETTDPGSATPWDSKNVVGGNICEYDSVHAYGLLAAKFDSTPDPNSDAQLRWSTGIGTLTDWYGRIYLYCTVFPTSGNQFFIFQDLTNTNQKIMINAVGQLVAINAILGTALTVTTPISLNQFVRFEWHLVHSTSIGTWEMKLFNNPDSDIATEIVTSGTNNTGANLSSMGVGLQASGHSTTLWMDNIVAGTTSYPGQPADPVTFTGRHHRSMSRVG